MEDEEYTDEQLYQGVEVRPGVFRVKQRPYPLPRMLTNQSDGIHPSPKIGFHRSVAEVRYGEASKKFWEEYLDEVIDEYLKIQKP